MRIGVIDCDKKNAKHIFPNLALMKLSAWHKAKGDTVEWYETWTGKYDRVYVSKVFSFTEDYSEPIWADEIIRGGVDLQYLWWMARKYMTNQKTSHWLMRLSTRFRITPYME